MLIYDYSAFGNGLFQFLFMFTDPFLNFIDVIQGAQPNGDLGRLNLFLFFQPSCCFIERLLDQRWHELNPLLPAFQRGVIKSILQLLII